jgi:hypothetical protein
MNVWGNANYWVLTMSIGALIPFSNESFIAPIRVSLSVAAAGTVSTVVHARLPAFLEARDRKAKVAAVFD